jgi:hypothetical protein
MDRPAGVHLSSAAKRERAKGGKKDTAPRRHQSGQQQATSGPCQEFVATDRHSVCAVRRALGWQQPLRHCAD